MRWLERIRNRSARKSSRRSKEWEGRKSFERGEVEEWGEPRDQMNNVNLAFAQAAVVLVSWLGWAEVWVGPRTRKLNFLRYWPDRQNEQSRVCTE